MSDDRESRIAALERQLAALRAEDDDGEQTQVVKRPHAEEHADRIAALERQLQDVIGAGEIDQRPVIQVIQRTEVDTAKKKKRVRTPREEKAQQVVAWGCAVAMVLLAAMCFGATAMLP